MNNSKTVLWILDYFPNPYDSSTGTWAFETVKNLRRMDINVCVLVPTPWIPRSLAFSEKFKILSKLPSEYEFDGIKVFYTKCLFYPTRKIRTNLYLPYMNISHQLFVWPYCKNVIDQIYKRFSPKIIHGNFSFPNTILGCAIKKKYGIPLIFHERSLLEPIRGDKRCVQSYKQILKRSDYLLAPSNKVITLIKSIFDQIPKYSVIHDVFDITNCNKFKNPKPKRFQDKKIILTVGALIDRKGHFVLLQALKNVVKMQKNFICIIIGSGKNHHKIKEMVYQLELEEYIKIYGQRSFQEVLETMSWSDFFVLPSWNEAFGTVYSEAMSFGKPIIACKTEGISEVIIHGKHGILVNPKDIDSLTNAIYKLLKDETLLKKMNIETKKLTEQVLNYDITTRKLIDVYNILST